MSLAELTRPFSWTLYSKKLMAKIYNPRCVGSFHPDEAAAKGMRCLTGSAGKREEGNRITLFWLVDLFDGKIVDAKFQAFGPSALIGAAEAACELMIGKTYDQARRMSADFIDKAVRDRPEQPAFPNETAFSLNLVIDAVDEVAKQCMDIPLPANYVTPMPADAIEGKGYPGWLELPLAKKMAVIEEVLTHDIRPFIELDAGGIEVLNLIDNREVIISYSGSCTNCFSATGTTLSYIQQVLRAKVHPDLVVVPNMG